MRRHPMSTQTKFYGGDDYPWMCDFCRAAIEGVKQLFVEDMMPDTDDPEAPAMYVYDNAMECGGHECIHDPDDNECQCKGCQLRRKQQQIQQEEAPL